MLLSAKLLKDKPVHPSSRVADALKRAGVQRTEEFERIDQIPRRLIPTDIPDLTPVFRTATGAMSLWPVQSWALWEAETAGGLFGMISAGSGKCVDGATEVFDVGSGRRRRVDELGAFRIAAATERGRVLEANCYSVKSGQKACVRLALRSGDVLVLSEDHPVLTGRGWIQAASLLEDDLIASARVYPEPVSPTKISDDEVKLLAYLIADGSLTVGVTFTDDNPATLAEVTELGNKLTRPDLQREAWSTSKLRLVDVADIRDRYAGGETQKAIGVRYGIGQGHVGQIVRGKLWLKYNQAGVVVKDEPTSKNRSTTLSLRGVKWLLKRYGVHGVKSKHKRAPDSFYALTRKHIALFLNRFWTCDGHVNLKSRSLEMTLASEGLIRDIRFFLRRLGVISYGRQRVAKCEGKKFDAWTLIISGRDNVLQFFDNVGLLHGQEGKCQILLDSLPSTGNTNTDVVPIGPEAIDTLASERPDISRPQLRRWLGKEKHHLSRNRWSRFCSEFSYRGSLACFADTDVAWGKIRSVEPCGVRDVYDISVPSTGAFVANGVVIHNTLTSLLLPDVLGADRAVLLIKPQLRRQLLDVDLPRYSKDFRLPLDRLHIVAYTDLSSADQAGILEEIQPDLIIADECHAVARHQSARSKRLYRFLEARPDVRFCGLSGTVGRKSILDYAHLLRFALKNSCPVPEGRELVDWAKAIDAGEEPMPPGILLQWVDKTYQLRRGMTTAGLVVRDGVVIEAAPVYRSLVGRPIAAIADAVDVGSYGQTEVRAAYQRRLTETRGVVATSEAEVGSSLIIKRLRTPELPSELRTLMASVQATGKIDDEELEDPMAMGRVMRQLAVGFHYRWRWPNGEKDWDWLQARANWHREVRSWLEKSLPGLDSPLLLARAAQQGKIRVEHWAAWAAEREKPEPPVDAVWTSDFAVDAAIEWGRLSSAEFPGVIWYEHDAFGRRVAEKGKLPFYGPGDDASKRIAVVDYRKEPAIVASIKAHGEGKNLQMYAFGLVTTPPSSGTTWEQLCSRLHRPGQEADEVTFEVWQHTEAYRAAFDSAIEQSRFIQQTHGTRQKLCIATILEDDDS